MRKAIYVLAVLLGLTHPALAQETADPVEAPEESSIPQEEPPAPPPSTKKKTRNNPSALQVQWYKPTVGISEKPKKFSRVILSGLTKAGTKVRLSDEVALLNSKGDVKTVSSKTIFSDQTSTADDRGLFDLNLDLPFVTAQLPIEVTSPDGEIRRFQINLEVRREDVRLTNQKDVVNSPYLRRTWGVWGGLGANYLSYEQESADIPSSLKLESFGAPSLYGKIVRSINKEWAFQATANMSPGKTSSSSTVKVDKGDYNWTYFTGEFSFYHPNWKMRYKKYFSEFGAQWGLQYHMVPFIARSSTTDATAASVENNDILMAAFGGTWLIHYDRYWLLETFVRYQVPYTTGSLFDIAPNFAFDGSIGVIYKWKPDWRVGGFWYGQWHDYKFRNHRDKFSGEKIDGDQTLFFSNFEFRVGWEFD